MATPYQAYIPAEATPLQTLPAEATSLQTFVETTNLQALLLLFEATPLQSLPAKAKSAQITAVQDQAQNTGEMDTQTNIGK